MINMVSIKSITIVVLLCFNLCAKSANALTIDTNLTSSDYDPRQNFTVNENEDLFIRVNNLDTRITEGCKASCRVKQVTVELSCEVIEHQETFLNVSVKKTITKELDGKWVCTYQVTEKHEIITENISTQLNSNFILYVMDSKSTVFDTLNWFSVAGGIVLLVIIIQAGCILHFRRKAKAIRREAQWSSKHKENTETINKTVRYSKMPGLKKKEVLVPESRESGIYEVLDNIRVAPVPPPVESLPRKKAYQKSAPPSPAPTDSSASTPWGTLALNSLLRKKNKKDQESGLNSNTSTLDKRTTLDRIKERPKLDIPTEEEVYEAMETPPSVRKEIKKKVYKEKPVEEESRSVPQPKPKPAVPLPTGNGALPLNSQLKQAVEKGIRLKPVYPSPSRSPIIPKELPQQHPPQAQIPKHKLWNNEPQLSKRKPLPNEPTPPNTNTWNETTIPKTKVWPNDTTIPKEKAWQNESQFPKAKVPIPIKPKPPLPQEQEMQQEPQLGMGSLRPKVAAFNPGLPPPDAPPAKIRTPWGEVMPPKPRPPPPAKPKQLHPLPQPPHAPEHIHVVTEYDDRDGDSDDSEEWVYEQLPQYNIYSM